MVHNSITRGSGIHPTRTSRFLLRTHQSTPKIIFHFQTKKHSQSKPGKNLQAYDSIRFKNQTDTITINTVSDVLLGVKGYLVDVEGRDGDGAQAVTDGKFCGLFYSSPVNISR